MHTVSGTYQAVRIGEGREVDDLGTYIRVTCEVNLVQRVTALACAEQATFRLGTREY